MILELSHKCDIVVSERNHNITLAEQFWNHERNHNTTHAGQF
jgi:hypothetical protein